jgi:diguanylate cyclase (GGDEF)-like protein
MHNLFDNAQMLGLLVQAMGALSIGLLCIMLCGVVSSTALSAWGRGWLSLAAALIALLTEQAAPATAILTMPLYLFGEYLFGLWIMEGCAHFGGRRWPRGLSLYLVAPLAAFAAAMPHLIGYEFRKLFILQTLALFISFICALIAMSPASKHAPRSPGTMAIRTALTLLSVIFCSYLPIFGANLWWGVPLPLTILKISSAAHLAFEFLLGFGGAVLVLEQSHLGLQGQNEALSSDVVKLRGQAERDALTNAYNRRALIERFTCVLTRAAQTRSKVALLYLDIDHFKDVNDTYGHAFGDQLLISVAQRLQQCVQADDLVVRMGGDEFILITDHAQSPADVETLAERIKTVVSGLFAVGAAAIRVSFSMGIAIYPDDSLDADVLLKHADIALHQAKAGGRNMFRVFDPKMNQNNQERVFITSALASALESGEMFVDYQPVVDLPTGRLIGLEALIRWRHPERGLIPPSDFIAIAEQSGLINAIGEFVIREVCRQLKDWQAEFVPLVPVAVNVSSLQFERQRVADLFVQVIEEFDIDPALIRIEITETELMRNMQEHAETLRRLRDFGVKISIDDFGTGYSSLRYLKDLPIDCLKIDRSFIAQMMSDARDAAIVYAVIGIARSMGIIMIAEGVEAADQVARLCEFGCFAAQGYFFHRPMSPALCKPLLEELGSHTVHTETQRLRIQRWTGAVEVEA